MDSKSENAYQVTLSTDNQNKLDSLPDQYRSSEGNIKG